MLSSAFTMDADFITGPKTFLIPYMNCLIFRLSMYTCSSSALFFHRWFWMLRSSLWHWTTRCRNLAFTRWNDEWGFLFNFVFPFRFNITNQCWWHFFVWPMFPFAALHMISRSDVHSSVICWTELGIKRWCSTPAAYSLVKFGSVKFQRRGVFDAWASACLDVEFRHKQPIYIYINDLWYAEWINI